MDAKQAHEKISRIRALLSNGGFPYGVKEAVLYGSVVPLREGKRDRIGDIDIYFQIDWDTIPYADFMGFPDDRRGRKIRKAVKTSPQERIDIQYGSETLAKHVSCFPHPDDVQKVWEERRQEINSRFSGKNRDRALRTLNKREQKARAYSTYIRGHVIFPERPKKVIFAPCSPPDSID